MVENYRDENTGEDVNILHTMIHEMSHAHLDHLDRKDIPRGIAMVFLPESVKKAIDRYIKVRRSRGSNRVFINSKGEAMTYDGIRREIYKVAEKAGIKFSAHRARRFYARFLYKEGLDLEEIRLLMRHEKIDTTKDYIQMMQEDAIDVLRKRKIDFFEDETGSNPGRHSRLGRDLNPCHGLDRPV